MHGQRAKQPFRMQRPTDNLRQDHVLTKQAIAVLCAMAAQVRAGGDFPAADCAELLRFLREFVLATHLRKENEILGPAIAMRGDDEAATLVGELLRMQDDVSELIHSLVLFWEPLGELTSAERAGFADTAAAFAARQRRMMDLEERQLFPACDAAVPADDQLDWVAAFARLEAERAPRADWQRRIDALAGAWLG